MTALRRPTRPGFRGVSLSSLSCCLYLVIVRRFTPVNLAARSRAAVMAGLPNAERMEIKQLVTV